MLRKKALPYMLEHADHIEQQLERHGPGEPTVRLSLTDDVFLRSSNWARWQLGNPLPVERSGAGMIQSRRLGVVLRGVTADAALPSRQPRTGS